MAVLRAARLKLFNIPDIIIIQKIQGWLSNRKINCIYIPLTGLRATGLKQVKLLGNHYHTNKTQGWLSNGVMNCTYIPLTVLRAAGLKQVHKYRKNGYLIAQYTVPLNQFIMYKSEACGTLPPLPSHSP